MSSLKQAEQYIKCRNNEVLAQILEVYLLEIERYVELLKPKNGKTYSRKQIAFAVGKVSFRWVAFVDLALLPTTCNNMLRDAAFMRHNISDRYANIEELLIKYVSYKEAV